MAGAAQVAFAFFTYRAHKKDRALGLDGRAFERLEKSDEGGKTTAVVGDAGAIESAVVAAHREVRGGREDCVEMRADHKERRKRTAFAQTDAVAFFVKIRRL